MTLDTRNACQLQTRLVHSCGSFPEVWEWEWVLFLSPAWSRTLAQFILFGLDLQGPEVAKCLFGLQTPGGLIGFVCQLGTSQNHQRERSHSWANASMRSSSKYIFSNSDQWRRAQLIVDGAIPGLQVLGSRKKQTEQVMWSKSVRSTPLWPLDQFLPPKTLAYFSSCTDLLQCWKVLWKC